MPWNRRSHYCITTCGSVTVFGAEVNDLRPSGPISTPFYEMSMILTRVTQ